MTPLPHVPDPRLDGLTGPARRAKYLALCAAANAERRAERRLPTRHATVIAEMKRAQLLPAPSPDATSDDEGAALMTDDERRGIRNKLKAMRRGRRS